MVDYLKEKFESEQKVRKEEMEVKWWGSCPPYCWAD
jgi:hypothetical protein